jgi:hypothetical protein
VGGVSVHDAGAGRGLRADGGGMNRKGTAATIL